jgi:2-haloacid dehalogenase
LRILRKAGYEITGVNVAYKAVLFDLGSTLIEYENHDWSELGKMGIIAAHPYLKNLFPDLPPVHIFGPNFYKHLRDILDSRLEDAEVNLYDVVGEIFRRMEIISQDGLIEKFVDIYYKPVTDQISMIPGAADVLKAIKDSNKVIGLVSNSIFPEKFHLGEMARFGLHKYFDFTIFSSSVGFRKPGRRIFELALKRAGVEASEAIFIGDRFDADVAGANNAGIASVWRNRAGRENADDIEPDFSIENLTDLLTIVLR